MQYNKIIRGDGMNVEKFTIKKIQSSNKTIRMPDELIERIQVLADKNDISFNQLVIQCCQYALNNMTDISHTEK